MTTTQIPQPSNLQISTSPLINKPYHLLYGEDSLTELNYILKKQLNQHTQEENEVNIPNLLSTDYEIRRYRKICGLIPENRETPWNIQHNRYNNNLVEKIIQDGIETHKSFLTNNIIDNLYKELCDDYGVLYIQNRNNDRGDRGLINSIVRQFDGNNFFCNRFYPVISPYFIKEHEYKNIEERSELMMFDFLKGLDDWYSLPELFNNSDGLYDDLTDKYSCSFITANQIRSIFTGNYITNQDECNKWANWYNHDSLQMLFSKLMKIIRKIISEGLESHLKYNEEMINKIEHNEKTFFTGLINHIEIVKKYYDYFHKIQVLLGECYLDIILSFVDSCYGDDCCDIGEEIGNIDCLYEIYMTGDGGYDFLRKIWRLQENIKKVYDNKIIDPFENDFLVESYDDEYNIDSDDDYDGDDDSPQRPFYVYHILNKYLEKLETGYKNTLLRNDKDPNERGLYMIYDNYFKWLYDRDGKMPEYVKEIQGIYGDRFLSNHFEKMEIIKDKYLNYNYKNYREGVNMTFYNSKHSFIPRFKYHFTGDYGETLFNFNMRTDYLIETLKNKEEIFYHKDLLKMMRLKLIYDASQEIEETYLHRQFKLRNMIYYISNNKDKIKIILKYLIKKNKKIIWLRSIKNYLKNGLDCCVCYNNFYEDRERGIWSFCNECGNAILCGKCRNHMRESRGNFCEGCQSVICPFCRSCSYENEN